MHLPGPDFPEKLSQAISTQQGRDVFIGEVPLLPPKSMLFDPGRLIVLHCDHMKFARAALKTMLEAWQFVPAKKGSEVVEVTVMAEVEFRLRPH